MIPEWNAVVLNLDCSPFQFQGKDATLGKLAESALDAALPGDEQDNLSIKLTRFHLIERIRANEDIKPEEIDAVKQRIGKAFSPSVVGRACALLKV